MDLGLAVTSAAGIYFGFGLLQLREREPLR
jgi:hypothetical protein